MNKVEPIRKAEKVKTMYEYLAGKDRTLRDATLFLFGVSSAYRISDLLNLKYENVFNTDYRFHEYVRTKESKTRKYKQFKCPDNLRKKLKEYAIKNKIREGDYLFPTKKNKQLKLDRINVWRRLKKAATTVGIKNFGTHSMRKTFGYHYYTRYPNRIGELMKVFNHSSIAYTLMYIGIEQEGLDKVYAELEEIWEI